MSTRQPTTDHTRAESLLEDFVLGTLAPDDHTWMSKHVSTCDICGPEVASLRSALQHLPLIANDPPVAMNSDVWDRIEQSISGTEPPRSLDAARRRRTPAALRYQAVAAVAVIALLLGLLGGQLLPRLFDEDDVVTYQISGTAGAFEAELEYHEDTGVLLLSNVPAPSSGQVYQAWLIAGSSAPVPVGVVDASTGTLAIATNLESWDLFALTLEPGPLGSTAPTSNPVAIAELQ